MTTVVTLRLRSLSSWCWPASPSLALMLTVAVMLNLPGAEEVNTATPLLSDTREWPTAASGDCSLAPAPGLTLQSMLRMGRAEP